MPLVQRKSRRRNVITALGVSEKVLGAIRDPRHGFVQ